MSDLERIEAAMEEKVRPSLRAHGGDISIDHVEGKTVYVKLLGQCAGCPSADLTNETIVEAELKAALPDLVEKAVVVQSAMSCGNRRKSCCGSIICKKYKNSSACTANGGVFSVFCGYSRVTTGMTMGLRLVFLKR